MTKTSRLRRGFWRHHSLTLVAAAILGAWVFLYARSDPKTHAGAFFGNAIADWSGTVCIVLATKFFFESGSSESRQPPRRRSESAAGHFLRAHSLTIALVFTGLGWLALYARMDPESKWGQVAGNVLSEWVQMIGLVLLTKKLFEAHSKESHSSR